MKKILVVVLGLLISILFVACVGANNEDVNLTETSIYNTDNDYAESPENIEPTQNEGLIYDSTDLYEYEDYGEGIIITEFTNYSVVEYDKIIVPSHIDGKKVVGIGNPKEMVKAFTCVYGDCEVVIPETVEFIGTYAFFMAEGLTKVSGGANCKTISEGAFGYCENLKEVTFIDTVENIDEYAFEGSSYSYQ